MSAALYWRSVTPSNSRSFDVSGTELSVAIFGQNRRFAAYEIRCRGAHGYPDRYYIIRDAELICDADVAAGKRPPIVERTSNYDQLLAFVERESS